MRLLLVGQHELSCALFRRLQERADMTMGVVVSARESHDPPGRASLRTIASAAGAELLPDEAKPPLSAPIQRFRPDVLVSTGFDRIIRPAVIDAVAVAVNVHFGKLPRYRGSYSIPWAILNDDDEIGVTVHKIAPGIDDGPILFQETFANDRTLSCGELYAKAVSIGVRLVESMLDLVTPGERAPERPQDESRATYFPPTYPNGFRVPWRQTARYVANYVRAAAFPPFEGAVSQIGGRRIEFLWPVDIREAWPNALPGRVVEADGRGWIATVNGFIGPRDVVADGRRMSFIELCRGDELFGARFE